MTVDETIAYTFPAESDELCVDLGPSNDDDCEIFSSFCVGVAWFWYFFLIFSLFVWST